MNITKYSVILLILGVNCSPKLVTTYDYDKDVNFIHYSSYNFTPESNKMGIDQLTKKRIFNSISGELNKKGIMWSKEPDMFVHFHVNLKKTEKKTFTEVKSLGEDYKYDVGTGFTNSYIDYSEYQEGILIVEFIDSKKNLLLWRGIARVPLEENDKNPDKSIQKIVKKLLKQYPPR